MAAVTMSMAAVKATPFASSKSAFKGSKVVAVAPRRNVAPGGRASLQVRARRRRRDANRSRGAYARGVC
jgi:hypothetical protein